MNHGCRNAFALTFAALVFGAASAKSQQHPVAPADTTSSSVKGEASASRHVTNSVEIIHKLDSDVRMRAALGRAKGVFIVPSYRRAVIGVGAAGGTGILLSPAGGRAATGAGGGNGCAALGATHPAATALGLAANPA